MRTTCLARDNPFAMHHVERIPFQFGFEGWSQHLQRLQQMNYSGAIVGPEGSGKTTLMLELQQKLKNEFSRDRKISFVLIDEDPRIRKAQLQELMTFSIEQPILLIDGSERASWLQRRKLFGLVSQGTSVIAAVHQTCPLPTWIECSTNEDLMAYALQQLVPQASHPLHDLAFLRFRQRHGNVRLALRDLYDDWATGIWN